MAPWRTLDKGKKKIEKEPLKETYIHNLPLREQLKVNGINCFREVDIDYM